jgi:hypothetical protein
MTGVPEAQQHITTSVCTQAGRWKADDAWFTVQVDRAVRHVVDTLTGDQTRASGSASAHIASLKQQAPAGVLG